MIKTVSVVALTVALTACGSAPAAPTDAANVAGNWTGNLSLYAASQLQLVLPVNAVLSDTDGNVTGTWMATVSTPLGTFSGRFNGTRSAASFSGTFTYSGPNGTDTAICSGTGPINGPTGGATMRWTGSMTLSVPPASCSGPASGVGVVVDLQRQ